MDVSNDLLAAQRTLDGLDRVARGLRGSLGDTLDLRRLVDDLARLRTSLEMLAETAPRGGGSPRGGLRVEVITVPDGDYGPDFWQGADDEGVGARR